MGDSRPQQNDPAWKVALGDCRTALEKGCYPVTIPKDVLDGFFANRVKKFQKVIGDVDDKGSWAKDRDKVLKWATLIGMLTSLYALSDDKGEEEGAEVALYRAYTHVRSECRIASALLKFEVYC